MKAHYFSRFQQSIAYHEISSSKYIKGVCKISKHILFHNFLLMITFKQQFSSEVIFYHGNFQQTDVEETLQQQNKGEQSMTF